MRSRHILWLRQRLSLSMMATDTFGDISDVFEAMIDWPKRLANEQGFFRWLFERINATSVLDAACGTGHHAALFNSWLLRVEGADLSPTMIDRCRTHFGESDTLRWAVRGFDQPVDHPGSFDVVLCIGNSLALAPDPATISTAMSQLLAAARPGGAICVHVVNLWSFSDQPFWQKCLRTKLATGDSLIIKGVHRCGNRGYVDLLVTNLETQPPTLRSECPTFLGLEAADLEAMARHAGAGHVEIYGDYQRHSYDRQKSQDLILVAIKQ